MGVQHVLEEHTTFARGFTDIAGVNVGIGSEQDLCLIIFSCHRDSKRSIRKYPCESY